MEGIGEVIHNLRRRKGWTQGQLAYHAETSPEYISLIESGKRRKPSVEWLLKIATALETTPDYILTQAGLLPHSNNGPLPPEVLELAEVVEAYPDGAAKEQAKQMIVDIALILRTLRERMEEEREGAPERPAQLPRGTQRDR